MTSFKLWQLSAALVAAMLVPPGVTVARSPVPFKATLAITELLQNVPTPECFQTSDISGTGQATSLGKVTLVSRDCINPVSLTTLSFFSNQVILTAANGDQIFAIYSGTFTFEGPVGAILGGYQIIGGTGRFLGATGAGTVQGVEDISVTPAKGQIQLTGTILY